MWANTRDFATESGNQPHSWWHNITSGSHTVNLLIWMFVLVVVCLCHACDVAVNCVGQKLLPLSPSESREEWVERHPAEVFKGAVPWSSNGRCFSLSFVWMGLIAGQFSSVQFQSAMMYPATCLSRCSRLFRSNYLFITPSSRGG